MKKIINLIVQNNFYFWIFLICINIPMLIGIKDASSWSDDSAYTHLMILKAKFSPLLPLLCNITGEHHFAPVYNLFNIIVSSISLDPRFFHAVVVVCFISTAYFVRQIAVIVTQDKILGLLAAVLFSVNYYIAFKALHWNTFHSHVTNALTGSISVYFLFQYLSEWKVFKFLLSMIFLLLSILNYESGFVFIPTLIFIVFYYWRLKKISFIQFSSLSFFIGMVVLLFPLGSYLVHGDALPLSYRFKWEKHLQNYLFLMNELFFKSIGLAYYYNEFIINPLKENVELKEAMIQLLRFNNKEVLPQIGGYFIYFVGIFLATMVFLGGLIMLIIKKIRREVRLFLYLFIILYFIYIFVFYRVDLANAIAIFSSIVLADLILQLLRDGNVFYKRIGKIFVGVYIIATVGTIIDRFDDCYQKSFFGISKVAYAGPDKIYQEINKKIGRFAEDGIILFTHDYSMHHRTNGYERIGDMLAIGDLTLYHLAVYGEDFLKTDFKKKFQNESLVDFSAYFSMNPLYRKITVNSKQEAWDYINKNKIDCNKIAVIYLSKDYKVEKLNPSEN